MAAQGQGTAQAASGDAAQGQQAQQGDAQQQGPDFGSLVGTVEGLQSGYQETRQALDQVMQSLAGAPWLQQQDGQQAGQEQTPMDVDLSFLDAADPAFNPEQAATQLQSLVGQLVEQGVQQQVAPVQEQQAEMRRQWEAAQLTSEFPELSDPDTAREVVQSAQQYAQMFAPTIGAEAAQRLAQEPAFWRVMYGMGRAMDAAQDEGSGDPGAAHLEGGGGANPGGAAQVDPGDLIVQAAQGGRNSLPF